MMEVEYFFSPENCKLSPKNNVCKVNADAWHERHSLLQRKDTRESQPIVIVYPKRIRRREKLAIAQN